MEERFLKEQEKALQKMDKIEEANESDEDTNQENLMIDINDNFEEVSIQFDDSSI